MLRIVIVGMWVCFVAFSSLWIGLKRDPNDVTSSPTHEQNANCTFTRTDLLTVPVMIEGSVKGYVVTQLIYAVDNSLDWQTARSLSYYISDEIYNQLFRAYTSARMIERIKFSDIKRDIIENVNKRFGMKVLRDLFVQQFGYVSQEALRNRA